VAFPLTASEHEMRLIRAVPSSARRVLVVACGHGRIGAILQTLIPGREVLGVELDPINREVARLPLEPASLDAIVIADDSCNRPDLEASLSRYHSLLRPSGVLVALIANAGHHAALGRSGDVPFEVDSSNLQSSKRLFTRASAQRMFLDAKFAPDLIDIEVNRIPPSMLEIQRPLSGQERMELDARRFVFRAYPIAPVVDSSSSGSPTKLTFVVCVSDDEVLRENLLASPDLRPGTSHEIILVRNCQSAADGLNLGLSRARHEIVVCVHQDIYLPLGWCSRFAARWNEAKSRHSLLGVMGLYGVTGRGSDARRVGHVVDRTRLLYEPTLLPALCDTLDELLLALPRDTPVQFDPSLGFHLYGADACLSARRKGLPSVVVDAPCLHNSRLEALPGDFDTTARTFAAKWREELPVATPCVKIRNTTGFTQW